LDEFTKEINEIVLKYKLHIKYEKEDNGDIIAFFKEIDLVVSAKNKQEAIKLLLNDLKEYAVDYLNNFDLYFNSPNRKSHLPYILHVMLTKEDDLKNIIFK
jgi:antitoxin YefM